MSGDGERICVVGAGSWGTALGDVLARNGHEVSLWAHDPAVAREIRDASTNAKYLPGATLAAGVDAEAAMDRALEGAAVVVSATPSHAVREVFEEARGAFPPGALVVSGSKGIEIETGLRMSEVIASALAERATEDVAVLSGPSFAVELVRGLPTAVAAAAEDREVAVHCQRLFQNDHFRVYTQSDVIGTELGGSLKNVIAIAAGISDGLELGSNARAALLTRGLAELVRLTVALGGEEVTLSGLAGVGDLILTCTGGLSRNRRCGLALGRGATVEEALEEVEQVVEGIPTTRAARRLARANGVEMPIVDAVYSILFEAVEPRQALAELMAREPKPERWS